MKRQPSESGRPRGHVPRSQTQDQRQRTKEWWATLRGNHLPQNSLLHLPPAPSSGKWKYHSHAKMAPGPLQQPVLELLRIPAELTLLQQVHGAGVVAVVLQHELLPRQGEEVAPAVGDVLL